MDFGFVLLSTRKSSVNYVFTTEITGSCGHTCSYLQFAIIADVFLALSFDARPSRHHDLVALLRPFRCMSQILIRPVHDRSSLSLVNHALSYRDDLLECQDLKLFSRQYICIFILVDLLHQILIDGNLNLRNDFLLLQ